MVDENISQKFRFKKWMKQEIISFKKYSKMN